MSASIAGNIATTEELVAEVIDDVRLGLAAVLDPTGDEPCRATVVTAGPPCVVSWAYQGRQAEKFRSVERPRLAGGQPDADVTTVTGLTLVRVTDDGSLSFERHVDWNGMIAQLGVSRGRGSVRLTPR